MEPKGSFPCSQEPATGILNQINQVHTLQIYFSKIHFNIILLSTPRSSEWSLTFSLAKTVY